MNKQDEPLVLLRIEVGDTIRHRKFGDLLVLEVREDLPQFITVYGNLSLNRAAKETQITHINGAVVDESMLYVATPYVSSLGEVVAVPAPELIPFPVIEEPRPSISIPLPPAVKPRERKFHEPVPRMIDARLVKFLSENRNKVNIRLHWSEGIEGKVRDYFRRHNLEESTEWIRPLKSKMYAMSGEISFPTPPAYLFPLGVKSKNVKGRTFINNAEYALGLVLLGFSANKSARKK
jgi:hypothetical protein